MNMKYKKNDVLTYAEGAFFITSVESDGYIVKIFKKFTQGFELHPGESFYFNKYFVERHCKLDTSKTANTLKILFGE